MQCKSVFTAILATFHRHSKLPAPGRLKTCIAVHAPNGYAIFASLQFRYATVVQCLPVVSEVTRADRITTLGVESFGGRGASGDVEAVPKVSSGEEV